MAGEKDTIDEVIEALAPVEIGKKVRKKHKDAYTGYDHKGLPEEFDYEGFKQRVIEYTQHHWKSVYGSELPEELAFSRAIASLREIGGLEGALKMANKGQMSDVLKQIADQFEAEHVSSYRQHQLGRIDPNDWDSHMKIADRVTGMYKPLIKGDAKRRELMAKDYEATIQAHAQLQEGITDAYGAHKKKKAA